MVSFGMLAQAVTKALELLAAARQALVEKVKQGPQGGCFHGTAPERSRFHFPMALYRTPRGLSTVFSV